jgi:hypothetical protein
VHIAVQYLKGVLTIPEMYFTEMLLDGYEFTVCIAPVQ